MKSKGQIQIFAILLILITSCILVYEGYQRYLAPEKPDCINDNDCKEDEVCKQQMCQKIKCGYCQYIENRQCKAYECCYDFDCDDNNPETSDKCINSRTKDSKCEHKPIQKCQDGTVSGKCSNQKPLYCYNGTLANKCSACGCPSGQQCQADGSCITPTPPPVSCKCTSGPCCDGCNFKTSGSQPTVYNDDTNGFCSGSKIEASTCTNSASSTCYILTSDYYCNGTDANFHVSYTLKDTCDICKYCREDKLTCDYYDTNIFCRVSYCPIDACSNSSWLNYPETCTQFCGGSGTCNDCSCIAAKTCSKNCGAECDAPDDFSLGGTTCYYNCQTTVNLTNSCKFQSSARLDDANSCTIDTCTTGGVTHINITSCINNDGCCPANCGFLTDNDCSFLVNPKVMLIIFNPIIESQGNKKLTELKGWNDPDQLTQQYIQDIREASGNIVNYSVVERLEVDDINPLKDGFDYIDETYLQCLNDSSNCHIPWEADYLWILQTYNVCAKLNSNQIDELWMFGGPWFGYWEAVMAGPGAFNTNGPPISGTTCQRKLNIMGFNYERGVSEMLEDFVHRSEGTLSYVFGEDSRWGGGNYTTPWGKYALSDVTAPGKAACGWAHYAPNSQQSYDWSNQRIVSSSCEDWLNYPNLTGAFQQFNCTRWNCNGREFFKWWLKHLPKVPGFSDNKLNNWWRYIVDFNNI